MKINSTVSMVGLAILVFGVLIGSAVYKNNAPSKYDALAECITEKGGKMYGAYWCSACEKQKESFGSAFRKIDYVECSSPGSNSFDLCPDITSTPTWEKESGERFTGVRSLDVLAEEYSCQSALVQ